MSEVETTLAGRTVGRYELLSKIASGGMATVYVGRARGLGGFERTVAIKCCHAHLRDDEDFALMFLDEARLAARIHHPNVVATLDVGRDALLYLVMEYIDGDRLGELVRAATRAGKRLPVPVVVGIMVGALTGLHAAHELCGADGLPLGLIHRDVSPQNILVGADGITRLTDFGIARASSRAVITRSGEVKGKLAYMAPEQYRSEEVTRRVDLFAAGAVLWEALTGKRLFLGENDAATTSRVLFGNVKRPSEVVGGIPRELDAIVVKALERDPKKRFATAEEFVEALEAVSGGSASTRVVARCTEELLGPALAARRESIRTLVGTREGASAEPREREPLIVSSAPNDVPADVDTVLPPAGESTRLDTPAVAPAESSTMFDAVARMHTEMPDVSRDAPLPATRSRGLRVALSVVVAAIALAIGAWAMAWRTRSPDVVRASAIQPSVPPSPSTSVSTPAPNVAHPPVAAAALPSQPQPSPAPRDVPAPPAIEGPVATSPTAPANTAPSRRRRVRRSNGSAPGAPGEFIPGTL